MVYLQKYTEGQVTKKEAWMIQLIRMCVLCLYHNMKRIFSDIEKKKNIIIITWQMYRIILPSFGLGDLSQGL